VAKGLIICVDQRVGCCVKQASTNARRGSRPGGMRRRNSMLLPRHTDPQPESNNPSPTTSGSGWRDWSLY
jgi:hypothetical protein